MAIEQAARFAAQAKEHEKAWQNELFPRTLIDSLSEERFLRWSRLLILGEFPAHLFWTGLLQTMLNRAVRDGLPVARDLFDLVYPFHRRAFGGGVSFVENGIHLTLRTLFDVEAEISTTRPLLETLLQDCRSDSELLHVVLAARQGRCQLLEQVIEEWLESTDEDLRALATRLAGWVPALAPRLPHIAASDPSLYVRRVADAAVGAWNRERWAKHWFDTFLNDGPYEDRWGAGQLFLECADRRVYCWAWSELEGVRRARTRGEAFLLLEAAEQEAKRVEQKLDGTFLGAKVQDLKNLCHPWREGSWERLAPRG